MTAIPKTFRVWDYDVSNDRHAWRDYTRGELVADIAGAAILGLYERRTLDALGRSTLLGRAVAAGLAAAELDAALMAWSEWWEGRAEATLAGRRIVTAEAFAVLSKEPEPLEIVLAIRRVLDRVEQREAA